MSITKFVALPVATLIAIVAMFIWFNASAAGLVFHPSFPHGLAMCDGGADKPMTHSEGIQHTWKEDGISYVVNWGHLQDKGVKHLQIQATIECSNFIK